MGSRNPQKGENLLASWAIISFSEGHVLLAVIHTVFFVPFYGPLFHVNVCICLRFRTKFHQSIHGATAPSGPWPPSQDASIHLYSQLFSSFLLSTAVVVHPSEPHPPIYFLVFPLVCGMEVSI